MGTPSPPARSAIDSKESVISTKLPTELPLWSSHSPWKLVGSLSTISETSCNSQRNSFEAAAESSENFKDAFREAITSRCNLFLFPPLLAQTAVLDAYYPVDGIHEDVPADITPNDLVKDICGDNNDLMVHFKLPLPWRLNCPNASTPSDCFQLIRDLSHIRSSLVKICRQYLNNKNVLDAVLPQILAVELQFEAAPWFDEERNQQQKLLEYQFPWDGLTDYFGFSAHNLGVLTHKEYVVSTLLPAILDAFDYKNLNSHLHVVVGVLFSVVNTKFPFMNRHMATVAPLLLNTIDHSVTRIKFLGIQALHHFLREVDHSVLRASGLHQVFFDQLKPLLYSTESTEVLIVLPCTSHLLVILEKPPNDLYDNVYDEVWTKVLSFAVHENRSNRQLAIALCLPLLIQATGLSVIQHTRAILALLKYYVDMGDYNVCFAACAALVVFCRITTARKTGVKKRAVNHAMGRLQLLGKNYPEGMRSNSNLLLALQELSEN